MTPLPAQPYIKNISYEYDHIPTSVCAIEDIIDCIVQFHSRHMK